MIDYNNRRQVVLIVTLLNIYNKFLTFTHKKSQTIA